MKFIIKDGIVQGVFKELEETEKGKRFRNFIADGSKIYEPNDVEIIEADSEAIEGDIYKDGKFYRSEDSQKVSNNESTGLDITDENIYQLDKKSQEIKIERGEAIEVPYFDQAAQSVLFMKSNTQSYPNTMSSLRTIDDKLIESGEYKELTEGQKSVKLIEEVIKDLNI